jgi:mono/diheme cytochrome c family protein
MRERTRCSRGRRQIGQRPAVWLPPVGLLLALGCGFAITPLGGDAGGAVKGSGPQRSAAAGNLYDRRCLRCHGADGKGDGDRKGPMPDFKSRRWQAGHSDAQLLLSILEGKGTRMPAFDGKIKEKEARGLVSYIRSLGPAPAPKKKTAKDDFDRRFARLLNRFQKLREKIRKLSATRRAE